MEIVIVILMCILFVALQHVLSRRKHFIFGLICPALIVVSGILFIMFIAKSGTEKQWVFKFVILFIFSLTVYFEGRGKIKSKN